MDIMSPSTKWTKKRVAELRARLNASFAQMGERLGVDAVTYKRWETGQIEVNQRTAMVFDSIERQLDNPAMPGPLTASSCEAYALDGRVYVLPIDESPITKSIKALLTASGAVKSGTAR